MAGLFLLHESLKNYCANNIPVWNTPEESAIASTYLLTRLNQYIFTLLLEKIGNKIRLALKKIKKRAYLPVS